MSKCCICQNNIEREDPAILSLGGTGNARVLCDGCESLIDTATLGRDYEEIGSALGELGRRTADGDPDRVTYNVVNSIMMKAADRAKKIKDGTYDFSLDSETDGSDVDFDEIPEELKESEEDIEKDKADEEKMKKFDKVYNVIIILAVAAIVGIIAWRIIQSFI